MGQYLALGLTHQIIIPMENIRKYNISIQSIQQEIRQSLHFDMTLYDEEENDNNLVFTLKNNILEEGLIAFLEKLYPMIYATPTEKDEYMAALERLRETRSDEWLAFSRKKSNCAFQMDDYVDPRNIKMPLDFRPSVRLHFRCLVFRHGYGKIVTEGIFDFTNFFNYCIHETFRDHPIAQAMQVYITG